MFAVRMNFIWVVFFYNIGFGFFPLLLSSRAPSGNFSLLRKPEAHNFVKLFLHLYLLKVTQPVPIALVSHLHTRYYLQKGGATFFLKHRKV